MRSPFQVRVFTIAAALLLAGGVARAQSIATADLQIQGVGLAVLDVSVTTGLDIPASIQTEFGGKQNDEAPVVEGLRAVGELSGPGIDAPIRLETAPGRKFQIPGLSREGVYFLQNIRLMSGSDFLQTATPSVATITVTNLLQTSVRVRQLTPEELRERGISIDARNYDVYEYTFSFLIDGEIVEIPFPVVVDTRTHEVRPLPEEDPYNLPPVNQVLPPRWQPPEIFTFEMGPAPGLPEEPPADPEKPNKGPPTIPAALVIPNRLAVLHQFFAVTLVVTNGAPEGSSVTLDSVTAQIKPPAPLRVVDTIPTVSFNQPVPIVDATTGVTFLVAQAKGEAEWTMEGLQPGTHTVEVQVDATYQSPGQNDFPMRGTVRASVVVHDPRFNITFSHPDTVREGIDYSTFSFITNMSGAQQNIRVTSGLPECAVSPGSNVCRVDGTPEFHDLSIPPGDMRSIEYKLRPGLTGHVFATAGTVEGDVITAAVQLHMGVSETGIPLSPATLVMPYYARFVPEPMVSANLQLLGLGYSLATAPLTPALAKHPNVIKTDVFQRAVDIARAGRRAFLGESLSDSLAHMTLDLLGGSLELREWDELRRREKSGRTAAAAVARELETALGTDSVSLFADRFAAATAWRDPYLFALAHAPPDGTPQGPVALSVRSVASNARLAVASEAAEGWIRQLPFAELTRFNGGGRQGELAVAGRWTGEFELAVTPAADGAFSLDLILPAAAPGSVLRGHVDANGVAGETYTLLVTQGATVLELRNASGGIAAVGSLTEVFPEAVRVTGARQDLYLDPGGHKVSVLWNRPVSLAAGEDLLQKFAAQVVFDRDGVQYTGPRPISAAALQEGSRVGNLTFDHALSQNAGYSMTLGPLVDPLSGAPVSFPDPLVPVIDNDAPGGILFGHVLQGDNTPIVDAEVRLLLEGKGGPPQYDLSRGGDGAFLFEFVPRDIDNGYPGTYTLEAVTLDEKSTKVDGAVRLPGRVHFVNLVFLGRGSAEGTVRYTDGTVVADARVVVGSTMFDQFRTTRTDASGRYAVGDLPVGPLTFSATDDEGNVAFAASEIKTPGQVLQQDLSIFKRPFPGTATVRGVVNRSDTGAAVAGARVGVYTQGYGLVDGFTDSQGRFEFRDVPSGFVTVQAAEWNLSREAAAQDFDLAADETRDVILTLNVNLGETLVLLEGDVVREDPLFPGDTSKYQKVSGAIVQIDKGGTAVADANGHFVFPAIPVSFSNKDVLAYDPATKRSVTTKVPQLDPAQPNLLPIFISTADGYGKGTIRVRVLNAAGNPATSLRVIVPSFEPTGPIPLEEKSGGVYELVDVPVGAATEIWALGSGAAPYYDQTAHGTVTVEFNGHVASLPLRLPGQGTVRVKLTSDIDLIGDVTLSYPAWVEQWQSLASKEIETSTSENGIAGYATFSAVPAIQGFTASSAHPVYGYASQAGKLGFDGDVQSITLQLNRLSTVRGVVYAVDGRTPVAGAAVRIEDGRQNPGVFTTLQDGSFEFRNVAAGTGFRVIAEVTQDGTYRTGVASGSTPSAGGPVNGVAVVLRTQGGVDGRIVYKGYKVFDPQNPSNNVVDDTPADLTDNAPVPLARYDLRELDFPYRSFGTPADPLTADAAGRFSINNVFTVPLRVQASDPGNQEIRGVWTGGLTQEGERLTAWVAIGGEGFGPVTIRVLDPNEQNAAVLNAEVTLIRGNAAFDFTTTDGTGTARFADVPVGTYSASAYSKGLARSGSTGSFQVVAVTGAQRDVLLEFSGEVDGKLVDPEDSGNGIPGVPVTLTAQSFQTRATTLLDGVFTFDGVREGQFRLDAKDTDTNRRASASYLLTQADPNPYIELALEPTETLHLSVYLPDDAGGNSNVLVPVVNVDVRQRNNDFFRSLQGNSFAMAGLLRNEPYDITVKELGGNSRTIKTTRSFPQGSSTDPLKLVFAAWGDVDVRVTQAGAPASNAKVTVSGGGRSLVVYTDAAGVAVARGIPLGPVSVQVVSVDGAFSGSASATLASQSTPAVVAIALGAYAGITGLVEAEAGGPSAGTRVVASFSRTLEVLTDSTGRYTFQGITTGSTVSLTYVGPDDITVGARRTLTVGADAASTVIEVPTVRLDATPPQVVSFFPADGASSASPDSTVRITFSEPIQANQINTNHLQLVPADSSAPVPTIFSSYANPDGTFTVTMTPPPPPVGQIFPLKSNTLYRIIVTSEVRDLTGNRIPAARGASFITTDYTEPRIIKVIPDAASALQPATTFEFRFNEPIDPASWQAGGGGAVKLYKLSAPGPDGAILAEKAGNAFLDPATGASLFFAPAEAIEQESYYRVVISGVRDLQGNALAPQTFHFFSYDLVEPFVILVSPVPDGYPLISGNEYTLAVDVRNGDAAGSPAIDVAKVDYLRVDGEAETYLSTVTATPWSYRFVAPEAPAGGATFTLRAIATDLSLNEGDPATMSWQVEPNRAPENVVVALTPSGSVYPGNPVRVAVTFDDEGTWATVQLVASGTREDGTPFEISQVRQLTRERVDEAWPDAAFDVALPSTLIPGTSVTFVATVTDVRGLKGTGSASIGLTVDTTPPEIVSLSPAAQSRYEIGQTFQIVALVRDLETGPAQVRFSFDNQTLTVARPSSQVTQIDAHSWSFASGTIAVPAKNVDTTIPITVTAYDYGDNVVSRSTEIVYVGVNDPTVPKGLWLCPVASAAYPAGETVAVRLQVRATDDIAVTGVTFTVPGLTDPVAATRVGTTDVYEATVSLAMPAAGEPFAITATISDADPNHDVEMTIPLASVAVDVVVADRIQAITAADAADYEGKSILVRGASARLIPHVALGFSNLIVLDGARVETLSTTTTTERRLELTVTGHLYVDCASSIDVTARGYLGGWATNADGSGLRNEDARGRTVGNTAEGGPTPGAAGSHGGLGGEQGAGVANAAYGSIEDPTSLGTGGSGGASCCGIGAPGGGAVRILGGSLPEHPSIFVVAGAIRADGGTGVGSVEPGSGGSISMVAKQLIVGPAARISANGGDDDAQSNASRGGGGGRIAIAAGERLEVENVGLQIQARGGRNGTTSENATRLDGGAGTIFLRRPGQTLGELAVDGYDERYSSTVHLKRPTPLAGAALRFDRVTLGTHALVRADDALEIGGAVDDRTAATIAPTAVLVLQNDVPSLQVSTNPPADGTIIQHGSVAVTYTATSEAGVGSVRFDSSLLASDPVDAHFAYPASIAPSTPTQVSVPADAPAGAASLTLTVTDRALRSFTLDPISFTVVENTAPVIDAFDVTPSLQVYPGTTVTSTIAAHDDLKVTKITHTSTLGGGTPVVKTASPNAPSVPAQAFTTAIPAETAGGQTLTLQVAVEDSYPNRAATTDTRVVEILADANAPSVTITSPEADALYQEGTGLTIPVRATIVDAEVGVKEASVQMEGTLPVVLSRSGSAFSANLPVPPVDGIEIVTRTITVTAKDYAGNAASSVVTIRIEPINDPNAPVVSWACPTPGGLYPAGYGVKLRAKAIGNTTGNTANGIQKVEFFVGEDLTPILASTVSGLADHYEATYAIPADAPVGSTISIRAVGTNASGISESAATYFTIIDGVRFTEDRTIGPSDFTYDGQTLIVEAGTTTIAGNHTFENLIVLDGAKVTHPATSATTVHRLTFTADEAVFVSCGGSIDVSGRGLTGMSSGTGYTYDPATGLPTTTGGARDYEGGSHGGEGGDDAGGTPPAPYGSVFDPDTPGGAGAVNTGHTCMPCYSGGGVARIRTAALLLDGKILANGTADQVGGAGGSIRVEAGTVSGSGEIRADGGSEYRAGGGGRIAIYYQTLMIPQGMVSAAGGNTSAPERRGAAGTIYFGQIDAAGSLVADELIVDNLGRSAGRTTRIATSGRGTVVAVDGNVITLSDPVPYGIEGTRVDFYAVDGSFVASYEITGRTSNTVTVQIGDGGSAGNVVIGGEYRGSMAVTAAASRGAAILESEGMNARLLRGGGSGVIRLLGLRSDNDLLLTDQANLAVNRTLTAPNLALTNGSVLTHTRANATTIHRMELTVAGTISIDATSAIDVSGRGLTGMSGGTGYTYDPATGLPTTTGGARDYEGGSHGGEGGDDPGGTPPAPYGSVFDPDTPGGAGAVNTGNACMPCYSGGGVARIRAGALQLDGKILANGTADQVGGAGGSIRIDAGAIAGTGEIRADGGSEYRAGGGGRIAIYYETLTIPQGMISAAGGNATAAERRGAAGTIYLRRNGAGGTKIADELIVDNLGRSAGRTTKIATAGSGTVVAVDGNVITLSNPVPYDVEGTWIEILDGTGGVVAAYEIVSRAEMSVTVALPSGETAAHAPVGSPYRGMVRVSRATSRGAAILENTGLDVGTFGGGGGGILRLTDVRSSSDVVLDGANVEVNGTLTAPNLTLTNGSVLTHTRANATTIHRMELTVAGTISIDATSAIDVSGRGLTGMSGGTGYTYDPATGLPTTTGGARDYEGGSHGGEGGDDPGGTPPAPYGLVFDPDTPGGAGAVNAGNVCMPCYAGGGVARIRAGALHLDGKILANGTADQVGGAGGSIRIDAGAITGTGEIRADGGSEYRAGGGGRIAIYHQTLTIPQGMISAAGGNTSAAERRGAAGTIYLRQVDAGGALVADELIVDNLGRSVLQTTKIATSGSGTVVTVEGNVITLSNPVPYGIEGTWIDVLDDSGGVLGSWQVVGVTPAANAVALDAAPEADVVGRSYRGMFRVTRTAARGSAVPASEGLIVTTIGGSGGVTRTSAIRAFDDLTLEEGANVEVNGTLTAPNLALTNGSILTHTRASATSFHRLRVEVAGTISVDGTSAVDVTGRGLTGMSNGTGYTYDRATGLPTTTGGARDYEGASHGGEGGDDPGGTPPVPYGSVFDPNTPGGAGAVNTGNACMPCYSGGGVARIRAGALHLDGKILANGTADQVGGAGGSIRIDAGAIAGTGEIRADGGSEYRAGGGGRIAIYYETLTIPQGMISAAGGNTSATERRGAAGTIYLRQIDSSAAEIADELVVDNLGRTTTRRTTLTNVGYATVTELGTNFLRDANSQFFAPDQLRGVEVVVNYDRTRTWPIVSNEEHVLSLDVSTLPLVAAVGQPIRGLYRFDRMRLRNARLEVVDLVELTEPLDADASSVLVGNNQGPPILDGARVTVQETATGSAVVGTAGAVTDLDVPVRLFATNTSSGNVYSAYGAADGSFAVPVLGNGGDFVTLMARDANYFPLESPEIGAGQIAADTPVPTQIAKSEWGVDSNFLPRTISRSGPHAALASFPTSNGGSDRLVVLSVTDPAYPGFLRTVATSAGAIRDVVVSNGWAFIAADRFLTLNLDDPLATPIGTGNPPGSETAVALSGGYAFTAEDRYYNDGRIHVYDVTTPSAPRFIRTEVVGAVGGASYTDLLPMGSDYLVGLSDARPSGVGRDVTVIDRRDLYDLKKVVEIDIPNFDAFRGTVVDRMLYVASRTSPDLVVVDLSNVSSPQIVGRVTMPAPAAGTAVIGPDAFAATGANGLANLNIANPAVPAVTGATQVGGNAFDVAVIGAYVYVANELGVALVPAAVAPLIDVPRIEMSLVRTSVDVIGAPQSVTGNAPMTVAVHNLANDAVISGLAVQADGSFLATLPAAPGDPMTITATDAAGRQTGPLSLGGVPFGSGTKSIAIPVSMTDSNFKAQNVATDGDFMVVSSAVTDTGSDKLVVFDVTDRANPLHQRTVATSAGWIRDVAVRDGWAFVAADRLLTLDLTNSTSTVIATGNPPGSETAIELIGGYAVTAEDSYYNDGRLHIYDVSTPSIPRYIRTQVVAGISGFSFTDLERLGTDYLVGVSDDAPSGGGRDVMVIDHRDISNLRKIAELQIPNFTAFRGKVIGTKLYVAGIAGGMAVVDLSNPYAPVVEGVFQTAGYPRGVDAVGAIVAVADGSAGATFLDISPAGPPIMLGNQPLGGTAWECAFNGATLYIANEQGVAVIHDLGTPPLIDPSRITTSGDGVATATAVGIDKAVLGLDPITVELRNATTGAAVSGVFVGADGSFLASVAASAGDDLTIKATDSAGRVSGPLMIGTVPFGSATRHITISSAMTDAGFLARNVAADGDHVVVSAVAGSEASDKLVLFDASTPGEPVYTRTLASGSGWVRDVEVRDGWAYIAADRLLTLDLTDPVATPIATGNPPGSETAVELAGGYLFTAEDAYYNDGRIHVYDVSTPSSPRYIRTAVVAGISGYSFSDLKAFGSRYLVGISPNRPGGVGRDVMVIDRSDPNNLAKVSELDITGFDGFRADVLGDRVYVAGVAGGVAVVDLSNPASPQLVAISAAAGAARSIDIAGSTLVVANGSNGVAFIDVTAPHAPFVTGAHAIPGSAWELAISRGAIYVASELGLTAIADAAVPPMVDEPRITVAAAAASATVTGSRWSISGIEPLQVAVVNDLTQVASAPATVAADGSFVLSVPALPGEPLTLIATDAAGRTTARKLDLTFGTIVSQLANQSVASATDFRARRIATNGQITLVGTGSFYSADVPASARWLAFRPSMPVEVRTSGSGLVNDVHIREGFAYLSADRLLTVNLADPSLTENSAGGNPPGAESTVAVSGTRAFAAESFYYNDGRIHVYDVTNPGTPAHIHTQSVSGVGNFSFRTLVPLGSTHLIGISPERPGSTDRDLMVFDVTNVTGIVKVAELGISTFAAMDAILDGTTLYVAGGWPGIAIVDLTNPAAPQVLSQLDTPGHARGLAFSGANEIAVADGAAGVTFIDVTDRSNPVIKGSQRLAGNVVDVAVAGNEIHVAAENHYHVIIRP